MVANLRVCINREACGVGDLPKFFTFYDDSTKMLAYFPASYYGSVLACST